MSRAKIKLIVQAKSEFEFSIIMFGNMHKKDEIEFADRGHKHIHNIHWL